VNETVKSLARLTNCGVPETVEPVGSRSSHRRTRTSKALGPAEPTRKPNCIDVRLAPGPLNNASSAPPVRGLEPELKTVSVPVGMLS
jgi:hypothetical protein